AATAIREFPDGASGPPDARCIRGRRVEPIGTFDAYVHPFAHNDDPPLSFSLNMDDDAPSVMGSPELEDRYTLVIENACRATASERLISRKLGLPREEKIAHDFLDGRRRPRRRTLFSILPQRATLNKRCHRTDHGQRHTCQACAPSPIEKKMISARPIMFSNGT